MIFHTTNQLAKHLAKNQETQPGVDLDVDLEVDLEIGKKIDVWSKLAWHRRWERMPMYFTFWVIVSVVAASLFEIIPTFLIRSNVPTISTVTPYTPLELAGRDLYVAEGCYNCHSQMIRPILSETKRYGDYSKPGEFVYDHPFQWGSRRIGPDLAREGGKNSSLWHLVHFRDPNSLVKGSIMPTFGHLEQNELNFRSIPERVQAAAYLGAPYSEKELTNSIELAKQQARQIADDIVKQKGPEGLEDKQVIAMIAYLQRLGTDIYKTPEPEPDPAADVDVTAQITSSQESPE